MRRPPRDIALRAVQTVTRAPLLVALVSLLALVAPRVAWADDGLRIEDAVREAVTRNERARKAPLRVDQAEGQRERARSAFLPSLTATGSTTLNGAEDRNGNLTQTAGVLALQQPLLAPSAFPLYTQARRQLEAERWGAVQDVRLVAFDAARAFLQVLAAERVLEAANRRVERARANLDNADARASAQLASTNDATRARLELAIAARDAATAVGSAERAYLGLGFLLGRPVSPPLELPERTTRAAEAIADGPGLSKQIAPALERRADVLSARERTAALRASADEPLYRLAPTVGLGAQLRAQANPAQGERAVSEAATLTLTWGIFDAGFRYADRRTRVAQAESQALDEALLRRSVETDVALALASLRASREALRISEEAVTAAMQSVDETEILYRQGLARAIELTDANARRFDAEVNRAASRLAMEQAYFELRFALGLGPFDDEVTR
jgi:outer membrane protein TolC